MFGKAAQLSERELEKQLLIAESEVNRAQMVEDCQLIAKEVRGVVGQVKTMATWTSVGILLATIVAAKRPGKAASAAGKPSWMQRAFKSVRFIYSIVTTLRAAAKQRRSQAT